MKSRIKHATTFPAASIRNPRQTPSVHRRTKFTGDGPERKALSVRTGTSPTTVLLCELYLNTLPVSPELM